MPQTHSNYRFRELFDGLPQLQKKEAKQTVASQLGIGVPHLNKIIREETDPGGLQLRVIADFFDLAIDDLFTEERRPQPAAA